MHFSRRRTLISLAGLPLAACSAQRSKSAHETADVLILGAGLSGLAAARILSAEGMKVIVIEARDRPGGRLHTLDDVPGRPEAGGQQVGQSYARIRATARDLGLGLVTPPAPDRARTIVRGGSLIDSRDWSRHSANPLPEPYSTFTPDIAFQIAASRDNPLSDVYEWRETPLARDVAADEFLRGAGFDEDARRLCSVALNGNTLDTYSMVNAWRSLILYEQDRQLGPSQEVEGGSQRLPEAMAGSLSGGTVRFGQTIDAIEASQNGVDVTAGKARYRAPFAICTLPFPALRRIGLDAPLNPAHLEAIAALPYTQIHQVHLAIENEFWSADGLPVDMWTDTPIERVFAVRDESGTPVALTCWINGDGVRQNAAEQELSDLAERTLLELRGARVKARRVVRWDRNEVFSGGAYMHWAPGQIARWAEDMLQPAGRLRFAGEHLSHLHTGMEGAMESGEREALLLLNDATVPS